VANARLQLFGRSVFGIRDLLFWVRLQLLPRLYEDSLRNSIPTPYLLHIVPEELDLVRTGDLSLHLKL
jgi:hypothetical protein